MDVVVDRLERRLEGREVRARPGWLDVLEGGHQLGLPFAEHAQALEEVPLRRAAGACLFCEYRRERFVEHDDGFSVWDRDGALIHEADPNRVTSACAEQERYNRAVFDRIAQRPGSEA
jgi:hypothetical protein